MQTPMIALSGGKGGTGKTTVAVNLALAFKQDGLNVLLVDADVDAPNVHILLSTERKKIDTVYAFEPKFNFDECVLCGLCAQHCRIHAIMQVGDKYPMYFPDICTHCGSCMLVCPTNAITEGKKEMGWIYEGQAYGVDLLMGELKLGEASAATVVTELKDRLEEIRKNGKYDIIIIDTSPGAHCDVLRAVMDTEETIAVTEPTPFGAHDLERLIRLLEVVESPVKIVINRANITEGSSVIEKVAEKYNAPIISRIPYDDLAVEAYAKGKPVIVEYPDAPASLAIKEVMMKIKEELGIAR
ncbi:MAG: P-loop NTPase [Candidatus Asgardarchaeia archaeon]